ncbi:16S rRNA (cytosine(1402)-N(4))-methyltransferase RsmH [candidate division WOR-3 bacterium]|nr:16S rRNA (cytosine(1402)-N(4))-methyltransferase RsmH [candidate division WOR-3 bacterium]
MLHNPVLVKEVLSFIDKGIWVDATLGTGGHTSAILNKFEEVFVYAIDRDLESIAVAKKRLERFEGRAEFIHGNFRSLSEFITEEVSGVIFDIGLSSFQLEDRDRGFSYRTDGPLDMRVDRLEDIPLYKKISRLTKMEIENILKNYGEERRARSLSERIYRNRDRLFTTGDLMAIIKYDRRTLSRVFQAFRIFINQELENLKQGLHSALSILKPEGKIIVISYHSLEDRIVKNFFRETKSINIITKKPIIPSASEVSSNSRARSAKMRVGSRA